MEKVLLMSENVVVVISIITTILFLGMLKSNKIDKSKVKVLFLFYCNFIVNLCGLYYLQNYFNPGHVLVCIITIFCAINLIISLKFKIYNKNMGVFLLMIVIFFVLLGYTMYTEHYERQHDTRDFINYQYGGHFGYIGYIFYNNSLPNFSPVDYWCFYNPPLFYIISAIFMKFQTAIGASLAIGLENLQLMSLIYTMTFNLYVYKILKEMKIEKSIVYVLAFVGLSPAMIIMSGSLNNDILSIMLSTMAIYYTIKWYNEDTLLNLIKIALTISLAIMTKISAALIAVAIAFVFLTKVTKNKEKFKKYVLNFTIFALIALPIGLWYPIKNLVLYDVPITYVQSVDPSNAANISRFSSLERLFKISKENLETINVVMEGDKIDYNIYLSTLKSFIVDEQMNYEENLAMNISIHIVFIVAILISILFIVNLIYVIKNYKKINNHWLLFFGTIFILTIISYIKFSFDYPYTFTMNFRYIVPTLISFAVITGTASEHNKKLLYVNGSFITVFCIASVVLFANLL